MTTRGQDSARRLLERLPVAAYVLDLAPPATLVYVNPQAEALIGRSDGSSHVHEDDRPRVLAAFAALEPGEPRSIEYRLVRGDGSALRVRDTARLDGGLVYGCLVEISGEQELERALARERATLDAFFDTPALGLAITDDEGRYVRINETLARINGAPVEAHLGRTLEAVAPALASVVDPLRSRAAAATHDVEIDVGGEPRIMLVSYFPFAVDGRAFHGRVVVDVTEQRRLVRLLEELPLVAYVNDIRPARLPSYVSPRVEELTGHSVEAWLSDPALGDRIIHPDDLQEIVALEEEARRAGRDFEHEYRIVRADGQTRWVLDRMKTIADQEGVPLYEQGFLVDVTDGHETANLLRAVWDGAFEAMAIFDDEGRCVDANPAACRLLGWMPGGALEIEVLGHDAERGEVTVVGADGVERELEYASRRNVLPGRHLSVSRDVTDRRRLEEETWRARKLESVGRLAGGVAHEFNNLLTAIRGHAQLLEARTGRGSAEREHAREIDRAADRAAALTAQLLALGRRQTLQPRPLDLNRRLEELRDAFVELAGAERELALELDPMLSAVRVDPELIGAALLSLVENAADATRANGRIVVATANADLAGRDDVADGRYAVVSVADDGAGIDPGVVEHIFEPFFTTKPVGEGSGLGLASAYGTVRQSGGTITVETAPGGGSTFSVYLPEAGPTLDAVPAQPGHGETIVVVEHDPAVRDVLFETLTDAGYRVLTTRTSVEAARLVEQSGARVDLAVADREVSGVRTLSLQKPFAPDRLRRAVQDALRAGPAGVVPVSG